MGLKEDIGPWSNLKRSEWYRSGGGHNFWLVIIIAHAFQIIIVMIQIVHFIQVELRAAFTSAHHPCKAAIIDFKHSDFRTNSTLVNCLKFRQWYMMDGKWSYIILYHLIHTLLHSALQSLYLSDKTSWLVQPKEQDGPRCAHSVHANVSPRQRSPDLGFPPTSPVPFQGWKQLETAARQGCWITFNRFGWHPALPTQKKTSPWLSNLFNAVIEPVDFHFWIVDRQAILVSIRWCYPPQAFVIPLPKMASRRPTSSFDKKVQRTSDWSKYRAFLDIVQQ